MTTCNYERDCSIIPIPGKCVEYCLERLLRNATMEEKQLILGLDRTTAEAIFSAYNTYSINSFEDLQQRVTSEQIAIVKDKFTQVNQFQLNYFKRSRQERDIIINALKNMHLDMEEDNLLA